MNLQLRRSDLVRVGAPFVLGFPLAFFASAPTHAAVNSQECLAEMQRSDFTWFPRGPRGGGDPHLTPRYSTDAERRQLGDILWPNDFSARASVRGWLLKDMFGCIEQAFDDLDQANAKYQNGSTKVLSFMGAVGDYAVAKNGLTDEDVAELIGRWKAQYPKSILAELAWPRLLNAAAWRERGNGYGNSVSGEGWEAFKRLNGQALQKVNSVSPAAKSHLLWQYVSLRVRADTGTPAAELANDSLKALQLFPGETDLTVLPALRLRPKWGGSPAQFEEFASRVMKSQGNQPERAYAKLYMQLVNLPQLSEEPEVRMTIVRVGLTQAARSLAYEDILALQVFACYLKDEESFRLTQSLWKDYGKVIQVSAPAELDALPAPCRAWAKSFSAN